MGRQPPRLNACTVAHSGFRNAIGETTMNHNPENAATSHPEEPQRSSRGKVTLVNYATPFLIAGILVLAGYAVLTAH